jgi:hypothetical protein
LKRKRPRGVTSANSLLQLVVAKDEQEKERKELSRKGFLSLVVAEKEER